MAEEKIVKHVVTNTTDGPKVLNARPAVVLQAGQSTEGQAEMTEAEHNAAKATEWFKFGAPPRSADKD